MVVRTIPLSASLALLLAAAPLQAQLTEVQEPKRFELIPVAGYVWGGSYETDVSNAFPAGHLRVQPSFAWGGILSFLAHGGSAVELTYLRQDSDIHFDPATGGAETALGSFAMNYIQ